MRFIRYLPVLLFLIDACVEPLETGLPAPVHSLVVDGMITDQPGPYTVRLFSSSKLDTFTIKHPDYEGGAYVSIVDEDGNVESLNETSYGIYQTSPTGMRGEVGKSYYIRIVTSKSDEYASKPQVLQPAGQIDKIYFGFHKDAFPLARVGLRDAFSINVDAHGTGDGLYRWRWTGTYKGETFPQLRKMITKAGPVPDPEPCSGYVRAGSGIRKITECNCCICWSNEVSSNAVVSDNRFSADDSFKAVEIGRLPLTGMRFYEKYYVEVEQISVSSEVYAFWKMVETQQRSTGSLFQPNAIRVRGNLTCLNDPKKEVLGIFSVSSVASKTFVMDNNEVPISIPPLDTISYNCIEGLRGTGTTLSRPPFW